MIDDRRLAELVAEADELHAEDPDHFDPELGYQQPAGHQVSEAQGLLGDDAPWWHRVGHVAHALADIEARE